MSEQMGWRSVLKRIKNEASQWSTIFPALPRKIDAFLMQDINKTKLLEAELTELKKQSEQQKQMIHVLVATVIALIVFGAWQLKN